MSQIITDRVRTSRRALLKGLTAAGARIVIGLPPLVSMFNSTGTAYAATPQTAAKAALVEKPECFQSRRLLGECRSFVRMHDGSTGARAGTHDDRVMAMAIALAARAELMGGAKGIGVKFQEVVHSI